MIIANPLFDAYFSRLMVHEPIAKFFVGTLLSCEVQSVQFRPKKYARVAERYKSWVDFAAVIKTENGETEEALVEVQKISALVTPNVGLGDYYTIWDESKIELQPVTTIYILGHNLPNRTNPYFRVQLQLVDAITGKSAIENGKFFDIPINDKYVMQAAREFDKHDHSPLNELLHLFEQRNFTNPEQTEKDMLFEPEIAEVCEMRKLLHDLVSDPEARKQLDLELELLNKNSRKDT
jgi:hypothetical protein